MDRRSPSNRTCPENDRLHALVAGQLDEHDFHHVLLHLQRCSDCRKTVQQMLAHTPEQVLPLSGQVDVPTMWSSYDTAEQQPTADAAASEACYGGSERSNSDGLRIGNYRLVRLIGVGGMGAVFKAVHRGLERVVAVKLLPCRGSKDPTAVKRFHREMRAHGRLRHPNVVTATDGGEENGQSYLVMEYVDGLDLGTIVQSLGPLRVADACAIVRQAALGVHALHAQGLIHRDVKPSNVMLTRQGEVKVLDLGLVLSIRSGDAQERLTAVGQAVGTTCYMAPEQFRPGHAVDGRADVYALGATLWSLLTARQPSPAPQADSPTCTGVDRTGLDPDVACQLAALLSRATDHDPSARFQSAQQFADALEPLCHGADLKQLAEQARSGRHIGISLDDQSAVDSCWWHRNPHAHTVEDRARLSLKLTAVAGIGLVLVTAVSAWWLRTRRAVDGLVRVVVGKQTAKPVSTQRAIAEWVLRKGGRVKPHGHEEVGKIADLPDRTLLVQAVSFYDMKHITEADLLPLTGLAHLQLLNLSRTSVTDGVASVLSRLRTLRHVYLNYTAVSDQTLEALATLPSVQTVSLKGTGLSDRQMALLGRMPALVYLDVSGTRITDRGLGKLAQVRSLRSLLVADTGVRGDALRTFTQLASLKRLDLARTECGDDQVPILAQATGLDELVLTGTRLSPTALARLQTALPHCRLVLH